MVPLARRLNQLVYKAARKKKKNITANYQRQKINSASRHHLSQYKMLGCLRDVLLPCACDHHFSLIP